MQIYLDYSATTPPYPEVIALMQRVMAEQWGNPASIHEWGQRSSMVVEQARMQIAELLNAPPEALIFTSGGTEADNLAIWGVAQQYRRPQHVVISSVEHSAVWKTALRLEEMGWQVTQLPVDRWGRVDPTELQTALQPNTVLVSIIYGQSEVGTIQPIHQLGTIVQAWRNQYGYDTLFHTDAVQVAGRCPIDVQQLPVDLLSLASHKLYGPQGVGALYVRPGLELVPLLSGGGQEFQLRSGTQMVPNIAGFGLAAQLAMQEMAQELPRLQRLRDRLFEQLIDHPWLIPTGDRLNRLPHHVSFCLRPEIAADLYFPQTNALVTGKNIVRQMNLAGIAISSGSACNSGKTIASPVLLAMGYDDPTAQTGIRLTLGRQTTEADVDWTAIALQQILSRFQLKPSFTPCRLAT